MSSVTLPPLALSTMWAQQERFRGRLPPLCEIAREAGFAAVEVSHATDEAGCARCCLRRAAVVSLHAPTPYTVTHRGSGNTALNLIGLDDAERREAVAAHCRTLDFAGEAGVRAMVVHLGTVSGPARLAERRLRDLYAAGQIDSEEAAHVRAEAIAARAEAVPAHLDAARRSLAEIVAYARPRGVAVGLETRLHYFEFPAPEDAATLMAEYPPEEAGYWHDAGHAEVWDRLGFVPHARWFQLLGERLIGCHLHDVRGLVDHRAPGAGDGGLDWALLASGIPATAARTCEIDQHEPEPLLAESVRFLRARGLAGDAAVS
jgi:sugar phosphate isomerase/epimerase